MSADVVHSFNALKIMSDVSFLIKYYLFSANLPALIAKISSLFKRFAWTRLRKNCAPEKILPQRFSNLLDNRVVEEGQRAARPPAGRACGPSEPQHRRHRGLTAADQWRAACPHGWSVNGPHSRPERI